MSSVLAERPMLAVVTSARLAKRRSRHIKELLIEMLLLGAALVAVLTTLGIVIGMPGATEAVATGSTDANMGVVRKIPSIAIGRSYGGNQHTLTEWAHWPSALPATKMLVLLAGTFGDGINVVVGRIVP